MINLNSTRKKENFPSFPPTSFFLFFSSLWWWVAVSTWAGRPPRLALPAGDEGSPREDPGALLNHPNQRPGVAFGRAMERGLPNCIHGPGEPRGESAGWGFICGKALIENKCWRVVRERVLKGGMKSSWKEGPGEVGRLGESGGWGGEGGYFFIKLHTE